MGEPGLRPENPRLAGNPRSARQHGEGSAEFASGVSLRISRRLILYSGGIFRHCNPLACRVKEMQMSLLHGQRDTLLRRQTQLLEGFQAHGMPCHVQPHQVESPAVRITAFSRSG